MGMAAGLMVKDKSRLAKNPNHQPASGRSYPDSDFLRVNMRCKLVRLLRDCLAFLQQTIEVTFDGFFGHAARFIQGFTLRGDSSHRFFLGFSGL